MTGLSATERAFRAAEAAEGPAAWAAEAVLPRGRLSLARLCLARLGGDPARELPRAELRARLNAALAELRGAVAAVGWDAGVAAWAAMEPATAGAVLEQARYLAAIEGREAA